METSLKNLPQQELLTLLENFYEQENNDIVIACAHDVKNPLGIIELSLGLLEDKLSPILEGQDQIKSQKILGLINNINIALARCEKTLDSTISLRKSCANIVKEEFSLISEGYYTALGMSLGMCFGVAIGAGFGGASVSVGVSLGMLIGLVIGRTKDVEAEKQNSQMKQKLEGNLEQLQEAESQVSETQSGEQKLQDELNNARGEAEQLQQRIKQQEEHERKLQEQLEKQQQSLQGSEKSIHSFNFCCNIDLLF